MKVLSRYDPQAVSLLQSTSFVVLYTYDESSSAWSKTSIEGPLFIYSRSSAPTYGLFVLNRNGMNNFIATLGERDERDTLGQELVRLHQQSADANSGTAPASASLSVDALFRSSTQASTPDTSGPSLLDQMFAQAAAPSPSPPAPLAAPVVAQAADKSLLDMLFAAGSSSASQASASPAVSQGKRGSSTQSGTSQHAHIQPPPAESLPLPLPSPTSPRRESYASALGSASRKSDAKAVKEANDSATTSAEGLMALLGLSKPAAGTDAPSANGRVAHSAGGPKRIGMQDLFGPGAVTLDRKLVLAAKEEIRTGEQHLLVVSSSRRKGIIAGRGVLLRVGKGRPTRREMEQEAQTRKTELRRGDYIVCASEHRDEEMDAETSEWLEGQGIALLRAQGEAFSAMQSACERLQRWTCFVSGAVRGDESGGELVVLF
ncbi:Decapping enzyme complex component DCP1 [Ceraceosorus bombacis]|uniref:Decapping enzyme complex component DCP1 n=1 Tax=Ceraceosorus bombacis TaxID=401625 RepID=A0A0P1B8V6_9BASI|nr:Decapping enzyme complex component DCP1 [Ceraceosorus bombacis]